MKLSQCNIQLKAFELDAINIAYDKIKNTAQHMNGLKLSGLISLPTHTRKITVNRSPHIDKKSREQFEVRTFSRVIQVTSNSNNENTLQDFIESLKNTVFYGLNIKVVFTYKDAILL